MLILLLFFTLIHVFCVQDESTHYLLVRRVKNPTVTTWNILPDSSDSAFKIFGWEEIERIFESGNYYWSLLSEDARQEVRCRIERLLGNSFVENFLEWFVRTCPGVIIDRHSQKKLDSVNEVKEKILGIVLEGSYIWGFKTQRLGEEYRPQDLDIIIIVKDSTEIPRKLNLKRTLTFKEMKFLFGKSNPRAPPRISVILIGEKAIKKAGNNLEKLEDEGLRETILKIAAVRGAGAWLAGVPVRISLPPPVVWHTSIKDIVKSAYQIKNILKASQLTPEEREELSKLKKLSSLSGGEEERLRFLQDRWEEEMKWHFRLMKRILEANARVLYFEEQNEMGISAGDFLFFNNPFLGRNAIDTLSLMIAYGVSEITQDFFISLQTRKKILKALEYLNNWVVRLERELRNRALPVLSPGSPLEEVAE